MNSTNRLSGLHQIAEPLRTFWSARNTRERTLLALALAVIVSGLIYLLLIDPALSGRERLSKSLPVLRQQVAELQALSKQAGAISANTPASVQPLSRETIEASLTRKGLKAQNIAITGNDVARVQLTAVPFASLISWIDEMQRTALLTVVEANATALPEAGMVNATFMLRQQRSE